MRNPKIQLSITGGQGRKSWNGDVKSAILRKGVKSELWRVAGGGKPKFSGGGGGVSPDAKS